MTDETPKHSNQLVTEKSPYLRQHAHNPVDWYPWSEAAFEKAKTDDKPVLLSIGYSTCHWCHVMERESFADEEIAEYLNDNFICIKLDREERPDLDAVYMKSFQALMGQGGGWPLNVFLTTDRKLFYGGTYFPPQPAGGRASFRQVLVGVKRAWDAQRAEVEQTGTRLHVELGKLFAQGSTSKGFLGLPEVAKTRATLLANLDAKEGGWGKGPKFPQPSHLLLLLTSPHAKEREAALFTCRKMAAGGIHDQLGGGFHRYSVDGNWLVPHFEKMLYDQSQLLECYLIAWKLIGETHFAQVARGIADFVIAQMQSPAGGYYSAQDAQSEGKEGKYWCWTTAELGEFLTPEERVVIQRVYGMSEKGNFYDFSDPEALSHQNVLSIVTDPGEDEATFLSAFTKMKAQRAQRVEPMTDDKILSSWNGLMIAAMAQAGRILDEPRYLHSAIKAWDFINAELWNNDRLANRWHTGEVEASQLSLNYLAMARAGRTLYSALLEVSYLERGLLYLEAAQKHFYDQAKGGFYDADARGDLVLRLKEDSDSALPASGSLALIELIHYAEMTGRSQYLEAAEKTLAFHRDSLLEEGVALPLMTRGLELLRQKNARLVLVGQGPAREELLKLAWRVGKPGLLILSNEGPLDVFVRTLTSKDGVTAYYCEGHTCRLPTAESQLIEQWLKE